MSEGFPNRRPQRAAFTVRRFKALVAHRYVDGIAELGSPRCDGRRRQRGYFDRIVRDEIAAAAIQRYVVANPAAGLRGDSQRRRSVAAYCPMALSRG